jgi:hypothetical protein
MHFLISCSKYDKTMQDLFSIVGMTCINFQNLSIEEIFLWLMTCENDLVLKEMCQFICKYGRWFFFSFWHFYFILFFCTGHEEESTLYYATFPWVPPLGAPLQNDNMKAHIYFYQFIQFWNYTLITYCSSALDTRSRSLLNVPRCISMYLSIYGVLSLLKNLYWLACV